MIRKYENKKIYSNGQIAMWLSIFSLLFSLIELGIFLVMKYTGDQRYPLLTAEYELPFFISLVAIPFFSLILASDHAKKENILDKLNDPAASERIKKSPIVQSLLDESVFFNDLFTIRAISIFFALSLIVPSFFYGIKGWINLFGMIFPPHSLTWIAYGFILYNDVLIRREWKDNPPNYLKEKKARASQKNVQAGESVSSSTENLLKISGMRFFLKYYTQLENLPVRDIVVEENYDNTEKNERILAAKKIFAENKVDEALRIIGTKKHLLSPSEKQIFDSLCNKKEPN